MRVPASSLPLLALIAFLLCALLVVLGARQRALHAEIDGLNAAARASAQRERALEATVARQHELSLTSDSELEMLRFQMAAVELQLDGVDYLSQEVRAELGLPPSAATWSGASAGESPQGGRGTVAGADRERLTLIQRRLAAGLTDLVQLLDVARSNREQRGDVRRGAEPALATLPALTEPPANWPARGAVTSPFGWRTYRGAPNFHTGIDIALSYGSEVLATGDGLVVGSGWQPGYGWSVLLQHSGGYNTLYAHLSSALVDVGDRVTIGDALGLSGSSGNSTGPHLHYEIWKDGNLLDPRPYMDGSGRP